MRTRLHPYLLFVALLLGLLGLVAVGTSREATSVPPLALVARPVALERAMTALELPTRAALAAERPTEPALAPVAPALEFAPSGVEAPATRHIFGFVLDERGAPIHGARLQAWRQVGSTLTLDADDAAFTDSSGAFVLDGEPRGATRVRVEHADYQTLDASLGDFDGERLHLHARKLLPGRVVDATGGSVGCARVSYRLEGCTATRGTVLSDVAGRFELRPDGPGRLVLDVSSAHGNLHAVEIDPATADEVQLVLPVTEPVRARVLDIDGTPLRAARVVLLPTGTRRALASTRSAADGSVLFEHAPDQPLELLAESPGRRFAPVPAGRSGLPTELRATLAAALRLVAATDVQLELALSPGPGVADVARTLVKRSSDDFVVENLAPGAWTLSVTTLSDSSGPLVRGTALVERELLLAAGSELAVELEIPPGGTLLGRAPGASIGAVEVQLLGALDGRLVDRTQLDAEGAFTFSALPAGSYQLELHAAGGGVYQDPRCFAVASGAVASITLGLPSDGLQLRVEDTFGRALPMAEVSILGSAPGTSAPRPGPSSSRTDRHGTTRYADPAARAADDGSVFLPWLAPAPSGAPLTTLFVTAPGFEPRCIEVHSTHLVVHLDRIEP